MWSWSSLVRPSYKSACPRQSSDKTAWELKSMNSKDVPARRLQTNAACTETIQLEQILSSIASQNRDIDREDSAKAETQFNCFDAVQTAETMETSPRLRVLFKIPAQENCWPVIGYVRLIFSPTHAFYWTNNCISVCRRVMRSINQTYPSYWDEQDKAS